MTKNFTTMYLVTLYTNMQKFGTRKCSFIYDMNIKILSLKKSKINKFLKYKKMTVNDALRNTK